MNWIDYVILFILLICIIDGLVKGFILTFLSAVRFILSIYIAKTFYLEVSKFLINRFELKKTLTNLFMQRMNQSSDNMVYSLFKYLYIDMMKGRDRMTDLFIYVISFLIVFIISSALLSIFMNILNGTKKSKLAQHFNLLGGAIVGIIKGLLVLYMVFAVVYVIMPIMTKGGFLASAIHASTLGEFFLKDNLIIDFIFKRYKL